MDREVAPRRFLRLACVVFAALALAICVLGWFDGSALFHDRNSCDLGGLSVTAGAHAPCVQDYVQLATYGVVPNPGWLVAFMVALMLPAAVVWTRPRLLLGFLWSPFAALASVVGLSATAAVDHARAHEQMRILPAFDAFATLLFVLLIGVIVLLPLGCGVVALLTRGPRAGGAPDGEMQAAIDAVIRGAAPAREPRARRG